MYWEKKSDKTDFYSCDRGFVYTKLCSFFYKMDSLLEQSESALYYLCHRQGLCCCFDIFLIEKTAKGMTTSERDLIIFVRFLKRKYNISMNT